MKSHPLLALTGIAGACALSVHAAAAVVPITVPGGQAFTVQQRTAAAAAAATTSSYCTVLTPFYWEIGDRNGAMGSGSGGQAGATQISAPKATTPMPIASASKWMFATYAVETRKGVLSAQDVKFLTFTSGFANMSQCSTDASVGSCLGEPGRTGGSNGDYTAAYDGGFYYDGGHMQQMAYGMNLGADKDGPLTVAVRNVTGADLPSFVYSQPQLAGGATVTTSGYALFLRGLLGSGRYHYMPSMLGSHAVCTHTHSKDCPTAIYSPVDESQPGAATNDRSDEAWHYSLGHWVEDDPTHGDGAFSSPGKFGFYPWIDKSKTYYGILARYDPVAGDLSGPKGAQTTSINCGRTIRAAWENPSAPIAGVTAAVARR